MKLPKSLTEKLIVILHLFIVILGATYIGVIIYKLINYSINY